MICRCPFLYVVATPDRGNLGRLWTSVCLSCMDVGLFVVRPLFKEGVHEFITSYHCTFGAVWRRWRLLCSPQLWWPRPRRSVGLGSLDYRLALAVWRPWWRRSRTPDVNLAKRAIKPGGESCQVFCERDMAVRCAVGPMGPLPAAKGRETRFLPHSDQPAYTLTITRPSCRVSLKPECLLWVNSGQSWVRERL